MTAMGWVRSQDFVGRWTDQRELTDFLRRVEAHDGGAVLLAGEPGIGKSRLAEDTADNAARAVSPSLGDAAGRAKERRRSGRGFKSCGNSTSIRCPLPVIPIRLLASGSSTR